MIIGSFNDKIVIRDIRDAKSILRWIRERRRRIRGRIVRLGELEKADLEEEFDE
jgi:hypothetical protein